MGDLLTNYDRLTITYDNIGNPLTYRDGLSFTWTRGRTLSEISKKGTALASYTYDDNGIRTAKTVNGVKTLFGYNESTLLYQKTGDTLISFIYETDGSPLGFTYGKDTYYYRKNMHGDITGIYNSSLTPVAYYQYDPWGKIVAILDGNKTDVSTNSNHIANINPLRYRGYYYDNETGFYYVGSRYYDPVVCRWLNPDTLTDGGAGILGVNLFIYAANNPINNSDPTGEWIIKDAIKWISKKVFKPAVKKAREVVSKLGNGTRTVGISGSGAYIFGGSFSVGLTSDNKGNVGVIVSKGKGVGSPSASVSAFKTWTNAPDIKSQEGGSVQSGGSIDFSGVSVGGEYTAFINPETEELYQGGTVTVGVGASVPVEVHFELAISSVYQINIFDELEKLCVKIEEW